MNHKCLIDRHISGVWRHHQTWGKTIVCIRRSNCSQNHHHHKKGMLRMIERLCECHLQPFRLMSLCCVLTEGLWRGIWRYELQTSPWRRELRLAICRSSGHGCQGNSSCWKQQMYTASSPLDRYWCKHKINTEDFVIQKTPVVFICLWYCI